MLKILLVDDHPVVREGLKKILAEEFDQVRCAEARDGLEALDLFSKDQWDVVVLDLSLPVKGGLEVLRELKRRRKSPPVLVLDARPNGFYATRSLRFGAAGYLTKQATPEELVNAVRRVMEGGR